MLVTNGAFVESRPTGKGYLRRVLTSGGADHDRVKCRRVQPSGRRLLKGVAMLRVSHRGGHLEKEVL